MTACHLVKNSRSLSEGTQNHQMNTRKKTANVVLGLTVIFLISYVPYHIWKTYLVFGIIADISGAEWSDKEFWINNLKHITTTLQIFLLINSCLNPVALFCLSLSFRGQFKRYLTCCCKANSPPTGFELTRRS
jgi:neuromedin B receptor/gastrin-releasing peptide receptor